MLPATLAHDGFVICKSESHGVHFLGEQDRWTMDLFSARMFSERVVADRTLLRVGGDWVMPLLHAGLHLKPPILRVGPSLVRR